MYYEDPDTGDPTWYPVTNQSDFFDNPPEEVVDQPTAETPVLRRSSRSSTSTTETNRRTINPSGERRMLYLLIMIYFIYIILCYIADCY